MSPNCTIVIKKKLNNKQIRSWTKERNKKKYKNKIDILSKSELCSMYKQFVKTIRRQYNSEIKRQAYIGRIPNFPEVISENIVLYALRHLGVDCTWNCSGDIEVTNKNKQIKGEVKCHVNGPTQFSPITKEKEGDTLYYLEAENHLYTGYFKLYEMKNYIEDLKRVRINKKSSLKEQQDSGRRPRFTLKSVWGEKLKNKLIWEGTIYDLIK